MQSIESAINNYYLPTLLRMRRYYEGAPRARARTALHAVYCSLDPRPSPSSAPCALRVVIKCGGGKTEAEGRPGRIYHVIRALSASDVTLLYV